MKKDNSAKSLPVKASKYPTKRTVNLAQRESHSRSTLTLTLGLVLIVVLSFCVANFGVLRQLDRQRAAENAYNTVHSQYTQMQQALADYDNVELQYRTYSAHGCRRRTPRSTSPWTGWRCWTCWRGI